MGGPGSGGYNRLTQKQLENRGTFRRDRHGGRVLSLPAPAPPVEAPAGRRRALKGLTGEARRIAAGLWDQYTDWSPATISTLRAYAQSCARMEMLRAGGLTRELHAEIRANLALLKALNLKD